MDRRRLDVDAHEMLARKEPPVSPHVIGDHALRQALTRAADGAFAIGPDGSIALWNRAAERILGWSAKEVLGRSCCEVLTGSSVDGTPLCYQGCHVMRLVMQGEAVQHFEMRTQSKAGKAVWLDISTLEAPATNGSPPMVVHLFRDVTVTRELLDLVRERLVSPEPSRGSKASLLTRREVEILQLMASGANTKVLAEHFRISRATIRNHAQNIFAKLGVHSRLQAVAYATQRHMF